MHNSFWRCRGAFALFWQFVKPINFIVIVVHMRYVGSVVKNGYGGKFKAICCFNSCIRVKFIFS